MIIIINNIHNIHYDNIGAIPQWLAPFLFNRLHYWRLFPKFAAD